MDWMEILIKFHDPRVYFLFIFIDNLKIGKSKNRKM